MVLAEAGACNVPVIAYRTGGVVEVVEDGKNGFLVESNNIDVLTEKIQFFLSNNDISNQMGSYGYQRVKNFFKWDGIVNTLIKIYRD